METCYEDEQSEQHETRKIGRGCHCAGQSTVVRVCAVLRVGWMHWLRGSVHEVANLICPDGTHSNDWIAARDAQADCGPKKHGVKKQQLRKWCEL